MSLRIGVVVETHPDDVSVDLVMVDNGERMTGVQVIVPGASTRTGDIDLPAVKPVGDKWDITKRSGQDVTAVVGTARGQHVVLGFILPQINQMTFDDPKLRVYRHQSDVIRMIDGDGNIDLLHPSGMAIRIGETPDHADPTLANSDKSLAVDRNTSRKPYIRITMADDVAQVTITPQGRVEVRCKEDVDVKSEASMRFEAADTIKFKAPGGMAFDTPNGHFSALVTAAVDAIAGNVSLVNHQNAGVTPGPALTQAPVPAASSDGPEWD